MAQVDENFVGTNETVTVMEEIGNSTRNATDHSVTSYDDDTVSAILIPLAIIGVLIVGAAVIFFIIRRKTAKQTRRQFAPVYYSVEHEESGNEWESQLMDEESAKHASIVKPNRGNQARLQFERGGST